MFFISNEEISLGEFFIIDISNGTKFQPSITITNVHGEDGICSNMHQIQEPRKGWANDLPLCPGNVLEIPAGAQC